MKEFLKRIKLIDNLTTELEIQKGEFVNMLKLNVDDGETGVLSGTFDAFTSSKNEYKGKVNNESFKIKRKRKFFDMSIFMAIASGTYTQKDNMLTIDTEIVGLNGITIFFYICTITFYSIFLITFATADEIGGNMPRVFAIPFLVFHAALVMGIPYIFMRRSTRRLKHDLEREFYYITKK